MDRPVPRRVLLCRLDPSLQAELSKALSNAALDVSVIICKEYEECPGHVKPDTTNIVFCPVSSNLGELVASLNSDVPVIVVSRVPDTREWIWAMENGACDYCAPPFETSQLEWILTGAEHGNPVLQAGA